MLFFETTTTTTSAESFVPVVVALVTAAAAMIAPRIAARGDDLKRAERLTALIEDMPPSRQRDLLEQLRDDCATTWALREVAPAPPLRRASRAAYWTGVAVLIAGAILLLLLPGMQWWYWISYLAGLALLAVGAVLHQRAMSQQREWMRAELLARGLRPPLDGRLGGAPATRRGWEDATGREKDTA